MRGARCAVRGRFFLGRMLPRRRHIVLPLSFTLAALHWQGCWCTVDAPVTTGAREDSGSSGAEGSGLNVVAYLPEWRYEGANWDVICAHTTHLILFSLEVSERGSIEALDRIPRPELLAQAREAASRHNTKLLICFGGNGRSRGFSGMTRSPHARRRFIQQLNTLLKAHSLDGIDYNWEYPGYDFRRGYLPDQEVNADYNGLMQLLKETRARFPSGVLTLSYYPDGRQERMLVAGGAPSWVDIFTVMAYDSKGRHSTMKHFEEAAAAALDAFPDPLQIAVGLPFYSRSLITGEWRSYEDIVQAHKDLDPDSDQVEDDFFNGITTIRRKVRHAVDSGIGGVMIWEVGQDCRVGAVTHGEKVHVKTCPKGEDSSLLVAITRELSMEATEAREEL